MTTSLAEGTNLHDWSDPGRYMLDHEWVSGMVTWS